jgi:predicted metal-dependent phosphoesterase TrpH
VNFANLHIHSYFSDGLESPAQVLRRVIAFPGLRCFALCDHDSLSGIEPMFRALAECPSETRARLRFVPAVELTVLEPSLNVRIHILGYFPRLRENNLDKELPRLDALLGARGALAAARRGVDEMNVRLAKAHALNLDGLADRHPRLEDAQLRLRQATDAGHAAIFAREAKDADIIRHPISFTYQDLVNHWAALVPGADRERILLYCLRPMAERRRRLAEIFMRDGMEEAEAALLAEERMSVLLRARTEADGPTDFLTPPEGLALLKEAGAVVVLAHPGVSYPDLPLEAVDDAVLRPLAAAGLDGVVVFYPYGKSVRSLLVRHYRALARQLGIKPAGGTDFHGDGRSGMAELRLPLRLCEDLLGVQLVILHGTE